MNRWEVDSNECAENAAWIGIRHNRGRTKRERKAKRNEETARKDADQHGQAESKDRGTTHQAQSKKDAEGKA